MGLMRLQIALEESFLEIGQMVTDQHVVILIDRGLLDGSAYVSRAEWQALMDELNMNVVVMRDNRYDGVLHLVTAAEGAEKFYASLSNEARYESKSEAIMKDKKLREAYMGHKNWVMIDNSASTFQEKINQAKQQVHFMLGRQGGTSFYKKFLLKNSSQRTMALTRVPLNLPEGQHYEESEVSETFINFKTNEGRVVEASIEKKGSNLAFAYTLKVTIEHKSTLINKKRCISASEYIDLKQNKLPDMEELNCQRICTMENGLYMIIDFYPQVENQPMICVIQLDETRMAEMNNKIKLPAYLDVEREITDLPEFKPKALAARIVSQRAARVEEEKKQGEVV